MSVPYDYIYSACVSPKLHKQNSSLSTESAIFGAIEA